MDERENDKSGPQRSWKELDRKMVGCVVPGPPCQSTCMLSCDFNALKAMHMCCLQMLHWSLLWQFRCLWTDKQSIIITVIIIIMFIE